MKTCVVYGDLSSDRASDNYPKVAVCDVCVEKDMAAKEDRVIVTVEDFNPYFGDCCALCEKTLDEEREEQK